MHDPRNGRNKLAACLWGTFCILLVLLPVGWAEDQWRIRINIPEYKLYLYQGFELYREYPIAVGKRDSPSPPGSFTIVNKVLNPTWYPPGRKQPPVPPGPNNPLGKYWLGLNIPGYGIHGNSAPWSIGSPVSLGCFRMNNEDIAQLFGIIPIGTPVEVVYETVIGGVDINDQAWLQVFPDIYRRERLGEELAGVFYGLPWIYQPHLKALQNLLSVSQRPCKVQVPRIIKIEGDIPGIDGFYWNGTVYVSRNILSVLNVSDIPGVSVNTLFNDYLELHYLKNLVGLSMNWNEAINTVSFNRALFEHLPPVFIEEGRLLDPPG